MTFAENLQQLPAITHLTAAHLRNAAGEVVATGVGVDPSAGDVAAAREGLEIFAEHTASARAHPGSHPNIDRLLEVITTGISLEVELIRAD